MNVEFIDSIHSVPAEQWDRLSPRDYPFTRHAFLAALEDSGSLGAGRGWQPQHLTLLDDRGQLAAVMPTYLKAHSYGEYVFDWAWANAYAEHGLDYYPKLVSAIPFTPCQGPRLLAGGDERAWAPAAAEALRQRALALGASGWHCLFPEAVLSEALAGAGSAVRTGCQFHWHNRGYRDFDDFLAAMNSRKRKNIRKERRQVAEQGIVFERREGAAISAGDWDNFYLLYQLTYLKRSGQGGYLTRDFFPLLGERLPDHVTMILAKRAGETIAAALFFKDATTLYGRYWGCREEYEFLHFETCYYQGLDYALDHGLQRFDGGAQGEHKVARGFEPTATVSNHWLVEPAFQAAVEDFVEREGREVLAYIEAARAHLPYKVG